VILHTFFSVKTYFESAPKIVDLRNSYSNYAVIPVQSLYGSLWAEGAGKSIIIFEAILLEG